MNTHLAEQIIEKISNRLTQSTTGKTTMKSSAIFKGLGFQSRKNSELIEYLYREKIIKLYRLIIVQNFTHFIPLIDNKQFMLTLDMKYKSWKMQ